jgi:hypothetical protein
MGAGVTQRSTLLAVAMLLFVLLSDTQGQTATTSSQSLPLEPICMANCSKPLFNELLAPPRWRCSAISRSCQ